MISKIISSLSIYIYISQKPHYPARYFTDHKREDKRLAGEKRGELWVNVILIKPGWFLFQKVGCDLRVGSNKNTDPCGVCGGNGSSCQSRYSWSLESISACSKSCGGGEWLVTKFIRLKHLQLVHRRLVHLHRTWEQWILMNFEPRESLNAYPFPEINNGYLNRFISPLIIVLVRLCRDCFPPWDARKFSFSLVFQMKMWREYRSENFIFPVFSFFFLRLKLKQFKMNVWN